MSDRIALCKGYTRLGVSFPEDRSRPSFQNVFFFKLDDGQIKKKKRDCVSASYTVVRVL